MAVLAKLSVPRGCILGPLLFLLLISLSESAPSPVSILEGYSSISKTSSPEPRRLHEGLEDPTLSDPKDTDEVETQIPELTVKAVENVLSEERQTVQGNETRFNVQKPVTEGSVEVTTDAEVVEFEDLEASHRYEEVELVEEITTESPTEVQTVSPSISMGAITDMMPKQLSKVEEVTETPILLTYEESLIPTSAPLVSENTELPETSTTAEIDFSTDTDEFDSKLISDTTIYEEVASTTPSKLSSEAPNSEREPESTTQYANSSETTKDSDIDLEVASSSTNLTEETLFVTKTKELNSSKARKSNVVPTVFSDSHDEINTTFIPDQLNEPNSDSTKEVKDTSENSESYLLKIDPNEAHGIDSSSKPDDLISESVNTMNSRIPNENIHSDQSKIPGEESEISPSLSNIDLSKINLSGIDLSSFDASSVDTSNIDLSALDIPRILSDLNSGNLDISSLVSQVSPNLHIRAPQNPSAIMQRFGPAINFDPMNRSFPQSSAPSFLQNFKPVKFTPFQQPIIQSYPQFVDPSSVYPKSSYKLSSIPNQSTRTIPNRGSFDYVDYDYPSAKDYPQYDIRPSNPYQGRLPTIAVKLPPPDKTKFFTSNNYPHKLQNRFVVPPSFTPLDQTGDEKYITAESVRPVGSYPIQQLQIPFPPFRNISSHPPNVVHLTNSFQSSTSPSSSQPSLTSGPLKNTKKAGLNLESVDLSKSDLPQISKNSSFETSYSNINFGNPNLGEHLGSIDLSQFNLSQIPDNFSFSSLDFNKMSSGFNSGNLNFDELSKNLGSIDLSTIDFSQIPENFSLADIDLSKILSSTSSGNLSLEELVENLGSIDLSTLDLSQIPENFSLGNLNLSSLDSGNVNLEEFALSFGIDPSNISQIDLSNLDLSALLSQFSPAGSLDYDFGDYPAFEIGEYDGTSGAVDFDYHEILPVTENEADKKLVEELGISQLVKMAGSFSFKSSSNMDFLICTMCKTGIVMGKKLMFDMKKSDREIQSLVIHVCIEFGMFPADVCRGMLNVVGEEVLHVLRTTTHSPGTFCGLMLSNQCKREALPSWDVERTGKEIMRKPDPITPPNTGGSYKILHISDLHLDLEYEEGTDSQCDRPLCCRNWPAADESSPRKESSLDKMVSRVFANADDPNFDLKNQGPDSIKNWGKAGKWGAFGQCDLPLRTIDSLLEAAAAHKPDLVYITGDLPAHDVWQQTRAGVLRSIRVVSERIRNTFPQTRVVMTVGNHETVPINSFPVPEVYDRGFSPSWLYGSLAREWGSWVPETSTETLLKGGYYSVSPAPGLRVLSVNSNYCNSMNWWLLLAHVDPTAQLKWLADQLESAESAKEKVHIVTHIPPGNKDCEQNWSQQFGKIVARFADTVTGVFAGHQHLDQWQVIHDPSAATQRPVGIVYIAPSATTFREHSPSFRVYSVDGAGPVPTWTVVDHSTYTMNLTLANMAGNMPVFERRYSALEGYNMTSLSPAAWAQLVRKMATDEGLFNHYMRLKHNYWDAPTEIQDCQQDCKERVLCYLVTGDSSNQAPCQNIKQLIQ